MGHILERNPGNIASGLRGERRVRRVRVEEILLQEDGHVSRGFDREIAEL